MRHIRFQIAALMTAALLPASCGKHDSALTVALRGEEAFGADNAAAVTLTLSRTSASPVIVFLSADRFESADMAIAPERLTFPASVPVPSGERSVTVPVQADVQGLEEGQYIAVLRIAGVDGGTADPQAYQSHIRLTVQSGDIAPRLQEEWEIAYDGIYSWAGDNYFAFTVSGTGSASYDVVVTKSGAVTDMAAFLKSEEEFLRGEGVDYSQYLFSQPDSPIIPIGEPGRYEAYVIGYSRNGKVTGQYNYVPFTLQPEPEADAAYLRWVGDWTVTDADCTLHIEDNLNNESYFVWGLAGADDLIINALYDPSDAGLRIPVQYVYTDEGGFDVMVYGIDNEEGIYYGDGNVASGAMTSESGRATLSGCSYTDGGVSYHIEEFGYMGDNGENFFYLTDLPLLSVEPAAVLVRDGAEAAPAKAVRRARKQAPRRTAVHPSFRSSVRKSLSVPQK